MYNLFIAYNENAWNGDPLIIEIGRFCEYTDSDVADRFHALDDVAVAELSRLPCIFGYERGVSGTDPKFGRLRAVRRLGNGEIKIEYEIIDLQPFLSEDDLTALSAELGINLHARGFSELDRTHWAVKHIDLFRVLLSHGIILPPWACYTPPPVNIITHRFDVALSFPGELRDEVAPLAKELRSQLGHDACFYDFFYTSQLARPSLDDLLQDIYRNRSRLIVVYLSSDYQSKDWCGVEFRAIKEIIMAREYDRIMYVRMDDGRVDGVLKTDGYIDGRRFSYLDIAHFVRQRIDLLPG